jgi:rod shape-determining protein MreB
MRLRARVAIDLGTVNTLVWVNGRGVVIEEPSAIALDRATGRVAAVGHAADALAGKEPQDIEVLFPLRDGVVVDLEAAAAMLHAFLARARPRRLPLAPAALVCVPSGATFVERRAVATAVEARRPRCVVRLVEEPVAAAVGAGFDLSGATGAFVVDVGGGTTEVAVVAGCRVVRARSVRMAGNAMDEAIISTVKSELGLVLGRKAARRLKATLGLTGGTAGWAEVVGLDAMQRTPRVERVPGHLVAAALEPVMSSLINAVEEMLWDIPPDVAEDVVQGKIRLTGGGSLLPGLSDRIEASTGIGTLVVDDPLRCVVRGVAEILEHGDSSQTAGLPA